MRIALSLIVLFTAACSTTNECTRCEERDEPGVFAVTVFEDTNDDGLPDVRIHRSGEPGATLFFDTDDDGLPDRGHVKVDEEVIMFVDHEEGDEKVRRHRIRVRKEHDRDQNLERTLRDLERAIARVRRSMK